MRTVVVRTVVVRTVVARTAVMRTVVIAPTRSLRSTAGQAAAPRPVGNRRFAPKKVPDRHAGNWPPQPPRHSILSNATHSFQRHCRRGSHRAVAWHGCPFQPALAGSPAVAGDHSRGSFASAIPPPAGLEHGRPPPALLSFTPSHVLRCIPTTGPGCSFSSNGSLSACNRRPGRHLRIVSRGRG